MIPPLGGGGRGFDSPLAPLEHIFIAEVSKNLPRSFQEVSPPINPLFIVTGIAFYHRDLNPLYLCKIEVHLTPNGRIRNNHGSSL